MKTLRHRLLSRTAIGDGCWEWAGARVAGGHGVIGRPGRGNGNVLTHRAMYELFVGPIPDGMCVCHKCDNPPCVRPSHMFLGTRGDNLRDMTNKGRHGHTKLTDEQVDQARSLLTCGYSGVEVAAMFDVSQSLISGIKNNKYRNLKRGQHPVEGLHTPGHVTIGATK